MQLLIATHNPAKFRRYQAILALYSHLTILAPADLGLNLAVEENGTTAAENAARKATTYAAASGLPSLGIDEALFIPALPPEEQPGVFVRRESGRTLSDDELLEVYLQKARSLLPEQRGVQWVYAICLALPDGRTFEAQSGWAGWLSDQPCLPFSPGYPLSAVLLDGQTRKPLNRLSEEETRRHEASLAQAVSKLVHRLL